MLKNDTREDVRPKSKFFPTTLKVKCNQDVFKYTHNFPNYHVEIRKADIFYDV